MENAIIPATLVGAITFFLLLAIVAYVVIRETVRVIVRPALVVVGVVLLATWGGVLDETVVGNGFAWIGETLIDGIGAVSDRVVEVWQGRTGGE